MVKYITTSDNPWNPATNFDEWLIYDIQKGYMTNERLAKIAKTSEALPDPINEEEIEKAMNYLTTVGAYDKDGNYVDYIIVESK